ncbi:MAG: hypothetical protein H6Q13_2381 [Bacteroidetes bacterium]|nr:hypothetical protein [Bacteroidota bacterium]
MSMKEYSKEQLGKKIKNQRKVIIILSIYLILSIIIQLYNALT